MFQDLLTKQNLLFLLILDKMVDAPVLEKFPMAEEAASQFGVNINTVKSVYAKLAQAGFVESRRRTGTKPIVTYRPEQIKAYRHAKDKVKGVIQSLECAGLSSHEIAALLVSAASAYSSCDGTVIYAENEFNQLMIGQQELENELAIPVIPRHIDDVITQLGAGAIRPAVIVTTFYCYDRLREFGDHIHIIPLKTTPPLEELINFSLIARDTAISLIVVTDEVRTRFEQMYPNIVKDFPRFRVFTLNTVLNNRALLADTKILLTLKIIYQENLELFRHIPKITTYNRFQDEEGLNYLRGLLG